MSNKQRHLMYMKLQKLAVQPVVKAKIISQSDFVVLGSLMYESYKGSIDYEGETLEESIQETKETLAGKYGELNAPSSFVAIEDGKAVAAVIFVSYQKENMPLLAFTMTHPKYQNRGLSQGLIKMSINSLVEQGYEQCCLVVTDQPAQSIYEKLGFRVR